MSADEVFQTVWKEIELINAGNQEDGMTVLYDLHADLAMSMHDVEQSRELILQLGAVGNG